jgi:hypothetical protein
VVVIVGPSHSGKSTAARAILGDGAIRRVSVLNDRSDESPAAYERVEWGEADGLRDTALLVEDLIACTDSQFKILQNLCNFSAHHSDCTPILILTHAIQRNGLGGILTYANRVLFTLRRTNASSLGHALDFLKFPKKEKERLVAEFVTASAGEGYGHCELNLESGKFVSKAAAAAAPAEGKATPPPIDASRYLEHVKDPKKALLLHDLIYPRLSDKIKTAGGSYELRLRTKAGEAVRASFVDYLDTLTDNSKRPTGAMRGVHKFVKEHVLIPDCLIANEALKEFGTTVINKNEKRRKRRRKLDRIR